MMMKMLARRRALVPWGALALCLTLTACGDDGGGGDDGNNAVNNDTPNNDTPNNDTPNNDNNNDDDRVRETVFPISYVARNRSEIPGIEPGGKLMVIASDGSFGPVQVSPEGIECHNGCVISDNLDWFVWLESDGMSSTLRAAPISDIDEDGATVDTGAQITIAQDILGFSLSGGTIVYETLDFEVFAGDLPGDDAESLGVVGNIEGTQGGFYLKPGGDQVLTWTVTLTSMTLQRFELASGGPFELYTFESNGFGGTGSFYGPRERMAWSPDGRFLAVASKGLTDTSPCQENAECVFPETCGANARCTSQRLVINVVDMMDADKLGRGCASTADCGANHLCDFADPQDPDSGKCLPGRLDMGAAGPQECEARQEGDFTDVRDTMTWSPDSQTLYLLMAEDCSRFNIPRVAILKTQPGLDTVTPILENPGSDFAVANCYDAVEDTFTVGSTGCVVNIDEMALSGDGNTMVFAGSSPAAANNIELYTIDRNGSREKRILTEDLETRVEQLRPLGNF